MSGKNGGGGKGFGEETSVQGKLQLQDGKLLSDEQRIVIFASVK